MTPERLMMVAQARGLSFDNAPGGQRPAYTVAELAIALGCIGVDPKRPEYSSAAMGKHLKTITAEARTEQERCYAAYAYRCAGDPTQKAPLLMHLNNEVWLGYGEWHGFSDHVPMALRENWPSKISNQKYKQRLCRLAVLEELAGAFINKHGLWPTLMAQDGFYGMTDELWHRKLSRRYEAVRHVIETWCATARWHINQRLQSEEVA